MDLIITIGAFLGGIAISTIAVVMIQRSKTNKLTQKTESANKLLSNAEKNSYRRVFILRVVGGWV